MNPAPTTRSEAPTEQRQPAKRSPRNTSNAHTGTPLSSTTLHRMKHILRNALPAYGLPCHPLRRAIDDQPWRSPLTPTPHCASSTDSNRIACRTESSLPSNRQTHALSEYNLSRLRWRNHGPLFQNEEHALLSSIASHNNPILLLQPHDCTPLSNHFYSLKTNKGRYDTTARFNTVPTPSLQLLEHTTHASTIKSKEESLSVHSPFSDRLISSHHHYHPKPTQSSLITTHQAHIHSHKLISHTFHPSRR